MPRAVLVQSRGDRTPIELFIWWLTCSLGSVILWNSLWRGSAMPTAMPPFASSVCRQRMLSAHPLPSLHHPAIPLSLEQQVCQQWDQRLISRAGPPMGAGPLHVAALPDQQSAHIGVPSRALLACHTLLFSSQTAVPKPAVDWHEANRAVKTRWGIFLVSKPADHWHKANGAE